MDPNQIQSNVPQGTANVPAPVTVQAAPQTQAPVNTQALQSFIEQAKSASQARFGNISETMSQHGYIFNPMNGQFERDPSYVDPATAYQLQLQSAKTPGTAQFGEAPADSTTLNGYIDSNGKPPPAGTTNAQLNSGKYRPINSQDQQAVQGVVQLDNLYSLIKQYSDKVNTYHSGQTIKTNPLQALKGLLGSHGVGGDANAVNFLNTQLPGLVQQFTGVLYGSTRYNAGQVGALLNSLPLASDTKEQAQQKLATYRNIIDTMKSQYLPAGEADNSYLDSVLKSGSK